jgi:hypothetical protein
MRTMLRAVGAEDKEARANAILDAVEKALPAPSRPDGERGGGGRGGEARQGHRLLYFPSKEEMLLALHERHVGASFAELIKLLRRGGPLTFTRSSRSPAALIVQRPRLPRPHEPVL